MEPRYVEVEPGVRLHCMTSGLDHDGPLVVLLHGFPEFWRAWRAQIAPLAAAGFRVVAPDQRGYNLSDKPASTKAYGTVRLAADVAAVIRACTRRGEEAKAFVVGHDWGAAVAWSVAMAHPALVRKVVTMNGPHPERLQRGLRSPAQLLRSWYMFFFQLPSLPEAIASLDDFSFLTKPLREEPVNPEAFPPDELARYREAFAQPGAVKAMIDWYRAAVRAPSVPVTPLAMPALVLWGEQDRHLGRELATPSPALVPDVRVVFVPEATHWITHDAKERVLAELLAFFRAP